MDTISSPSTLSHLRDGRVSMVDVGGKDVTVRVAVARADMVLPPEVSAYFSQHGCMRSPKGAITDMATVAAVMGAKKTADLVPLCHNITLTNVQLEVSLPQPQRLRLEATVSSRAQTGVEMEALTAVSMAALTVYDMCKSLSHNISIQDLHLVSKSGGKSDFSS